MTTFTFHFFLPSSPTTSSFSKPEAKIEAFIEMLGADARLLTEGEEIKSHDLFQQLFAKSTLTGEDEQQESALDYLDIIRKIRDEQPQLFERIKRLPKKARSARAAKPSEPAPALLTYFRRGRLEKFFAAEPHGSARELDFCSIARLLASVSDTPRAEVGADFYQPPQQQVVRDAATSEDGDAQPVASAILARRSFTLARKGSPKFSRLH
jgi:hypothetical protein